MCVPPREPHCGWRFQGFRDFYDRVDRARITAECVIVTV